MGKTKNSKEGTETKIEKLEKKQCLQCKKKQNIFPFFSPFRLKFVHSKVRTRSLQ